MISLSSASSAGKALASVIVSGALLCSPLFAYADSVANPPLGNACGLDIVLVMDSSDSITDGAHGTHDELGPMKNALTDFIDSLLPSTSAQIAVIDFDQISSTTPFTSDAAAAKAAVNAATRGGGTNWEQALANAKNLLDPRPAIPNFIIFASDGNPNYVGFPAQGTTTAAALAAAVDVANAIKSSGTRIMTIGIGNATGPDALNIDNLKAISGANLNTGDLSADVITTDFGIMAGDTAAIAQELCGTPVTATGGGGGGGSSGGGNGPIVGTFGVHNDSGSNNGNGGGGGSLPVFINGAPPADFVPGIPNTGEGGQQKENGLTLFFSALVALLGISALRKFQS